MRRAGQARHFSCKNPSALSRLQCGTCTASTLGAGCVPGQPLCGFHGVERRSTCSDFLTPLSFDANKGLVPQNRDHLPRSLPCPLVARRAKTERLPFILRAGKRVEGCLCKDAETDNECRFLFCVIATYPRIICSAHFGQRCRTNSFILVIADGLPFCLRHSASMLSAQHRGISSHQSLNSDLDSCS